MASVVGSESALQHEPSFQGDRAFKAAVR